MNDQKLMRPFSAVYLLKNKRMMNQTVKQPNSTLTSFFLAPLLFLILSGLTTMNTAMAETPDQQNITVEMIESYLDQAFENDPSETLVRYEEKELNAAWITSNFVNEPTQKAFTQQFSDNIDFYKGLTGLNIININNKGDNASFIMVLHEGNTTDITSHKRFSRYFYYMHKTKEARQKAIDEDRTENPMSVLKVFTRNPERTINLVISIINSKHKNVKSTKGASSITGQINGLFFRAFTRVKNLINLPSIESIPRQFEEPQPMDIAYIKSLYDPQLKAGMTYKEAKPILMKLMQQNLTAQNTL